MTKERKYYDRETCPVCEADLKQRLYDGLTDQGTEFELECQCGALLKVDVEMVPEYCLTVKQKELLP